MSDKRLYRSRGNRMLCGVCGGIGEYFNVDPTIIRLAFVLFGCTGTGIVAYFIAAVIIPDER
ncbi:PspC domain-containing protein [Luxibacter massiliensis]|uniref:PspC domain-containing protein n=1 Tax=Luxibacter massiliensis TaxID=2219695 RepID=UPI000F06440F|nr:PspC domain-containing protein [Luxibacter massiliensis]